MESQMYLYCIVVCTYNEYVKTYLHLHTDVFTTIV